MDEKEWLTYGLKVPEKILELVLLICLHLYLLYRMFVHNVWLLQILPVFSTTQSMFPNSEIRRMG
jgi:hypothetical protein